VLHVTVKSGLEDVPFRDANLQYICLHASDNSKRNHAEMVKACNPEGCESQSLGDKFKRVGDIKVSTGCQLTFTSPSCSDALEQQGSSGTESFPYKNINFMHMCMIYTV